MSYDSRFALLFSFFTALVKSIFVVRLTFDVRAAIRFVNSPGRKIVEAVLWVTSHEDCCIVISRESVDIYVIENCDAISAGIVNRGANELPLRLESQSANGCSTEFGLLEFIVFLY